MPGFRLLPFAIFFIGGLRGPSYRGPSTAVSGSHSNIETYIRANSRQLLTTGSTLRL